MLYGAVLIDSLNLFRLSQLESFSVWHKSFSIVPPFSGTSLLVLPTFTIYSTNLCIIILLSWPIYHIKIILLRKRNEGRREYVFFFVKEKTIYYADIISNVFRLWRRETWYLWVNICLLEVKLHLFGLRWDKNLGI